MGSKCRFSSLTGSHRYLFFRDTNHTPSAKRQRQGTLASLLQLTSISLIRLRVAKPFTRSEFGISSILTKTPPPNLKLPFLFGLQIPYLYTVNKLILAIATTSINFIVDVLSIIVYETRLKIKGKNLKIR
jgi:hypothetical protein